MQSTRRLLANAFTPFPVQTLSGVTAFFFCKYPSPLSFPANPLPLKTSYRSLSVALNQVTCLRPPRRPRRKPPYLWTVFFRLDGQTLQLSPQFELQGGAKFHFTQGSHGNLGFLPEEGPQALAIEPYLGQWETELQPIEVPFFDYAMPGILGVAAVLMQENNVSDLGADAGHQALNDYVKEAVNQAVHNFHVKVIDVENIQPSLKRYFARQVDALADGIESEVRRAVVKAQTWSQNLWSLVDQDELIGYRVWDLMATELPTEGSYALEHVWQAGSLGDWQIEGEIRIK